ncbi:hypothetical protein M8J75_008922 [Diaphorina citri]|nr:hypothetical protein M8J75_008922 [Diaphorina citri]
MTVVDNTDFPDWFSIPKKGTSAHAVPATKNWVPDVCTCTLTGFRLSGSAMDSPYPGGTAFLITVNLRTNMDQLTNFVSKSFTDRTKPSDEPFSNNNKDEPYPESNPVRSVTSSRASSMSPIVDPDDSRSSPHDSPLRLTTSPSESHHSDKDDSYLKWKSQPSLMKISIP